MKRFAVSLVIYNITLVQVKYKKFVELNLRRQNEV